jgi:hypothetical protein
MNRALRRHHMHVRNLVAFSLFLALSPPLWSRVLLEWSNTPLPSASSLGVGEVVFSWNSRVPASLMTRARSQGYRVYAEVPLAQARAAAELGTKSGWAGIVLNIPKSERARTQVAVSRLRSAYPKLQFLVLGLVGKQPQMRGSIVIKNDSVLEVSSPTAQPWIDTNLAAIRVEQRREQAQSPLYTFAWITPKQGQQKIITASDLALAVAEAGAFHADLVLRLNRRLQKSLSQNDAETLGLWRQVRSTLSFYSGATQEGARPAVNVAVVVDRFDPSDEALNLLARHNIPFQVFLAADLNATSAEGFNLVIAFSKPDENVAKQIAALAAGGKTVVLVDSHGNYPWHSNQPMTVNEHTQSYAVGAGTILEVSEPVGDPEAFAQDIRRLMGKSNSLLSLWNGLTTIAVPYKDDNGLLKSIELVNYATDPIRVQVQVKGSFNSIRYETPEHGCCQALPPIKHDSFTEFVIPELHIAGRVHLERP